MNRPERLESGSASMAVTIPLITPTILFNLVMQLVSAFQEFTGAFVITTAAP